MEIPTSATTPVAGLRQRRVLPPSSPSNANFASPSIDSIRNHHHHSTRGGLIGEKLSKEEVDAVLQQLCEKDQDDKKTWSRVFVERFLLNVSRKFWEGNDSTVYLLTEQSNSLNKRFHFIIFFFLLSEKLVLSQTPQPTRSQTSLGLL